MVKEKEVVIRNRLGMHVRPAAAFAQTAMKFSSSVTVTKDGMTVNAKSPIELLTLAATMGSKLTIKADGADCEKAVNALAEMINSGFGEE